MFEMRGHDATNFHRLDISSNNSNNSNKSSYLHHLLELPHVKCVCLWEDLFYLNFPFL